MPTVDLNADMGESFGPWKMGDDAALLQIISSANIACGGHAGDADVMSATMALARDNGVGIGAHPGFMDLAGFGRNRMSVPRGTLQNQVRYQVAASVGMARSLGTSVRHLKLHGALANMASEDEILARDLYEAALSVAPDLIVMVLAATAQQDAVQSLGCKWAGEIFADRAYNDDATLVDRSKPGAVGQNGQSRCDFDRGRPNNSCRDRYDLSARRHPRSRRYCPRCQIITARSRDRAEMF